MVESGCDDGGDARDFFFGFFFFSNVGRRNLLGDGKVRALCCGGFVCAPSVTGRPPALPRALLPSHLDDGVEVVLRGRLGFEGRDAWRVRVAALPKGSRVDDGSGWRVFSRGTCVFLFWILFIYFFAVKLKTKRRGCRRSVVSVVLCVSSRRMTTEWRPCGRARVGGSKAGRRFLVAAYRQTQPPRQRDLKKKQNKTKQQNTPRQNVSQQQF